MKYDSAKPLVDCATSNSFTDLEEIVKDRLGGRVKAFQLIVDSRGLVLRGKTRTYYVKQLAQHIIMEAGAARILSNDIEVVNGDEPPSGTG